MLAPYTILLHSIGGGLSLFIFLWIELFLKKRTHRIEISHNFALWFFFFTLFNFLSVVPLIFSLRDFFVNLGYNISVVLLLIGCVFIIKVPFAFFPDIKREILNIFISPALIILTLSIGVFQFIFPGKPYLDPSGKYIFWNPGFFPGILTVWALIGVALTFAIMFFRGTLNVKDEFVKIRSLLFAVGALSFANAAGYYFGAKIPSDLVFGLYFSLGGSFFIAFGIVLVDILKRHLGRAIIQNQEIT